MVGRFTAMLMLASLLGAQTSANAATPQPIPTNKSRFRIPFKIDPAALQRLNARELQLHVSRDGGVTWDQAQTLPPDGGKFEYQAAGDGEYWFAVKTLDGRNQVHPPVGQYETGLIVQVDTVAPLLELTLEQQGAGRVQLSWIAADSHLDISTLKIEYQQPGSQDWEAVEVTPKLSGQISWNVPEQGQLKVRGTVADAAGNVGRGQSQAEIIAVGAPAPKPRSGRRVPIADLDEGQEQAVANPIAPDQPAQVAPNSTATNSRPQISETPPSADPAHDASQPIARATPEATKPSIPKVGSPGSPADSNYRGPVITPFGGMAQTSPQSERFVTGNPDARPDIMKGRWGEDPIPEQSTALSPFSDLAQRSTAGGPAGASQNPSTSTASRNSNATRLVSSRRFQIGYTVDDVGPSGIGSVELFITQDMGRKWWKYGDDPDRRSPFDVEVPQDGEYGFSIRVRSGVGLTNDPPLAGEAPSFVVGVDQTPPTVELLSAQQGKGSESNRVQIRWRVADEHLASKPVAIYSSASRNGPWESVAGWTDDQGGFEWTVMPGSPSQFYVRIVARDSAGNTAKAETAQPILVDLVRPNARIVDVEAPQAGPR